MLNQLMEQKSVSFVDFVFCFFFRQSPITNTLTLHILNSVLLVFVFETASPVVQAALELLILLSPLHFPILRPTLSAGFAPQCPVKVVYFASVPMKYDFHNFWRSVALNFLV